MHNLSLAAGKYDQNRLTVRGNPPSGRPVKIGDNERK
jgi:hypothetical protein